MLRTLLGLATLAAIGCSPSQEEIQREFDDYVADANGCVQDDDCAIAAAECPLGCWVAVRADRVDDVERKARELVDDYESGGSGCAYECTEAPTPRCVDAVCTVD